MPGLDVWLAVSVEGGRDGRRTSNAGRLQVDHVEASCARDCATQDCCTAAVRDPAGVAVEVASVVTAAVQCRDRHQANGRGGNE
jgi:hypothetical protein